MRRARAGRKFSPLAAALLAAACATAPKGPDVAVMPGPGKSFEQFAADDRVCRDHADRSLKTEGGQGGPNGAAQGAVVGTMLGAAAGALLGFGRGGAVVEGAGLGLLMGSAAGANEEGMDERSSQRRYDVAYEQCMSAKGNRLPYDRDRYERRPIIIYQPAPEEASPPPPPPFPPPPT
jgi:uncharacterized protein YcfJ